MAVSETAGERHVRVMREVASALEAEGCPREVDMSRSPEVVRILRVAANETEELLRTNAVVPSVLMEEAPVTVQMCVRLAYRLLGSRPIGGAFA